MSLDNFGDEWLESGLPVYHGDGAKNKSVVRAAIDKLGGPQDFRRETITQPDGTEIIVQTKGAMPPQVTTKKKKAEEVKEKTVKFDSQVRIYAKASSGHAGAGYSYLINIPRLIHGETNGEPTLVPLAFDWTNSADGSCSFTVPVDTSGTFSHYGYMQIPGHSYGIFRAYGDARLMEDYISTDPSTGLDRVISKWYPGVTGFTQMRFKGFEYSEASSAYANAAYAKAFRTYLPIHEHKPQKKPAQASYSRMVNGVRVTRLVKFTPGSGFVTETDAVGNAVDTWNFDPVITALYTKHGLTPTTPTTVSGLPLAVFSPSARRLSIPVRCIEFGNDLAFIELDLDARTAELHPPPTPPSTLTAIYTDNAFADFRYLATNYFIAHGFKSDNTWVGVIHEHDVTPGAAKSVTSGTTVAFPHETLTTSAGLRRNTANYSCKIYTTDGDVYYHRISPNIRSELEGDRVTVRLTQAAAQMPEFTQPGMIYSTTSEYTYLESSTIVAGVAAYINILHGICVVAEATLTWSELLTQTAQTTFFGSDTLYPSVGGDFLHDNLLTWKEGVVVCAGGAQTVVAENECLRSTDTDTLYSVVYTLSVPEFPVPGFLEHLSAAVSPDGLHMILSVAGAQAGVDDIFYHNVLLKRSSKNSGFVVHPLDLTSSLVKATGETLQGPWWFDAHLLRDDTI